MSYASKFLNTRSTDTPATHAFGAPAPASSPFGNREPTTNSSLFGRRNPTYQAKTIDESAVAANPWAARAAAANGVKVEEKLNFESEKQFPTLGAAAPTQKKGAWGNTTVTAASLAADWAAKEAAEKAAYEAEKQRLAEEEEHQAAQRRRYTSFNPSRSDVFRQEVYQSNYDDDYEHGQDQYDNNYYDEPQEELQEEPNEEHSGAW